MEKQNDFLAAQLNAPDNFTLLDFYANGLTPDNTGLRDKDYYKNIQQVKDTFTDSNGNFNETAFDQFYDSTRRAYNEWATTDFSETIVRNIARAPENFFKIDNPNIRDTSTKLFQANDPWRHQRGFGNIYEIGKESYDVREVAQTNYVRDADGNKLNWTPNDKGGLWNGLFRNPMALAKDENGQLILDEEGNPFYQELKDGESTFGKEMLHYTDTLTAEDTWLNKVDFFDNDGLDKSVAGTLTRTIVSVAPYLIPGVGPWLGAIGAVLNLSRALPTLAKSVNGFINNNSDETDFGKTLNNIDAFWSKFDTTKSRHAMEHQWSFENIGDMIVKSAKQLFEQRTFTLIPEVLKLDATKANPELFKTLSLGYMALTSAEDSLETFKNAGMSDRSAGIAMLGYTAAMFALMNNDYFKDWLFQNSWVNAKPEITSAIKGNSKLAAKTIQESVQNATAKNPKLLKLADDATKEESQKLFKTVFNATKEAWSKKSIDPLKGINIKLPGAINAGNIYVHHALNEGIEEVMEEVALDGIKLTALGVEALGFDISDETKDNLNFNLTWSDAFQRYSTAFIGGAIGGAVFQGMDDWHSKVLNNDLSKYAGRGANGELIRAIRLYGRDAVISELDRLHEKGVLGNKNLAMKGKFTVDPSDESKQIWTWNESGQDVNQNDFVYNVMKNRIQTFSAIMADNNWLMDDNEILKQIQTDVKNEAAKEGLSEEAYRKRHGIHDFDEFARKTGFADVILTDVGNLMIDVVELEEKIGARKAYITSLYPDTRSSERDSALSKDSVIKQLEKERDEIKQQLDDIANGKAASYYIKYANFAAHSTLVSNILSSQGLDVLDKKTYAFVKYRATYDSIDEDAKKIIDTDYAEYLKLQGIQALQAANNLYQHIVSLVTPELSKQHGELTSANVTPSVYGNLQTGDLDTVDTSILLDRDGSITDLKALFNEDGSINPEGFRNWHNYVEDVLRTPVDTNGQPLTTANRYKKILDLAINLYTEQKNRNAVGIGSDDFIKYSFRLIASDLGKRISRMSSMKNKISDGILDIFRVKDFNGSSRDEVINMFDNDPDESLKAEIANLLEDLKYGDPDDNGPLDEIGRILTERKNRFVNRRFDENLGRYVGNDLLNDNEISFNLAIDKYKTILANLSSNPETALQQISDLETFLFTDGITTDPNVQEQVRDMFQIDLLKSVASSIKRAVDISKTTTKSPVIDLAKLITFDLVGEENPLLDMIQQERAELASKDVASKYLFSNQFNNEYLRVAEKVLPIVQSVIWAATNGINDEANKMLGSEGKEQLLPIIDDNLAWIYKNDLQFLQNQIEFLRELHDTNLQAKTREHILVRRNFYNNIVKFISQQDSDNNPIKAVTDMQEALGGFDLVESATRLGLLSFDFDDQTPENQVKMMKLFADFEHEIFNHVKSKNLNTFELGRKIYTVFDDMYKVKNGVLSKDVDDQLENSDIASYFLSVVGVDSYDFGRRIKSKFEGEGKKPFFGQEIAIRLAYVGIIAPELINGANQGLVDSIEYALNNGLIEPEDKAKIEDDVRYMKAKSPLWNTVIIDGFAGCGKSTVVLNTALSLVDNINAVAVSKIKSRAEAMGFESDKTFSLVDLLKTALNIDVYQEDKYIGENSDTKHSHVWKDPNIKLNLNLVFGESKDNSKRVLVIDECTLVKEGVWQALTNAAKEQNITIIGLGNLMQTGEINETSRVSAGLDDCIGVFSPKLTISMRDANSGKARNNELLGKEVAKIIDAKKDHPNWTDEKVAQGLILNPIVLKYYYASDGKLCGDHIIESISDSDIDETVASLDENETVLIVTTPDKFAASREKYKTNPNVKFVTPDSVQGSEADYVVLDVSFDGAAKAKITGFQDVYTLLTRAKKGTKILSSNGLSELGISQEEDATATTNVSFDPNSQASKEYVDTRLKALNLIPAEENPTPSPKPKTSPGEQPPANLVDEVIKKPGDKSDDEIITEIESDSEDDDAYEKEQNSGDEQLGAGLKGEKLKAFKKYNSLKAHKDIPLIDSEYFTEWLLNVSPTTLSEYSGLINPNNIAEEDFEQYKYFLKCISSILLNHTDDRYDTFMKRFHTIGIDNISRFTKDGFVQALENSFVNEDGVFFKKQFGENQMMLYYCFDKFAIPIAIYDVTDNEDSIEGFVQIDVTQETPIIPITSLGQKRNGVANTTSSAVNIASINGNPVTAIFLEPEQSWNSDVRRNHYFHRNVGKAFAMMLSEFGMTDDEIREIFNPEIGDSGLIEYFLKNDTNLYAIAGVQQDISIKDFFNILNDVNKLMYENVSAEEYTTTVDRVAAFFGKTSDQVREDFDVIRDISEKDNVTNNAKRFGKIRREYNMLFMREIDNLITALFAHFSSNDDKLSYFTENVIKSLGNYTSKNDANALRHKGLHFALNDEHNHQYNWYIVPDDNGNVFNVYYVGDNYAGESKNIIAKLNYNDLFKDANNNIRTNIQDILKTLIENEEIKNSIQQVRSDFNPSNMLSLMQRGEFIFSLATAIPDESGVINFYPPFEGEILKLIDNTGMDYSEFADFAEKSSIFKYGIYRQILTQGNDLYSGLWTRGNVPFEQLSWDIIKVLAPLYSIKLTNVNDSSLNSKFDRLRTPIISESGKIKIESQGNKVFFSENGEQTLVSNDEVNKLLIKNGFNPIDFNLETIEVTDNSLTFNLRNRLGTNSFTITVDNPKELLFDLFKEYINSDKIKNWRLVNEQVIGNYTYNNLKIQIVRVNNRYNELKIDGNYYTFKNYGKFETTDKSFVYISSDGFGDSNIHQIEVGKSDRILNDNASILLGYKTIDLVGGKIFYYYDNGQFIYQENGRKLELRPISISTNGIVVNIDGLDVTIEFSDLFENQRTFIQEQFNQSEFTTNNVKVKKTNKRWVFYGNLIGTVQLLRSISNYDGFQEDAIKQINFENKTILIGNKWYSLIVKKDIIDAKFNMIPEIKNIKSVIKNSLKTYSLDIKQLLDEIDSQEDPIGYLNDFLRNNVDVINKRLEAIINSTGNLEFVQSNPLEDLIIQKLVKETNSKYSDFRIEFTDEKTLDSRKFLVYLQNETVFSGTANLINENWTFELEKINDSSMSKDAFIEQLDRFEVEAGIDQQALDYINLFRRDIANKSKSRADKMLKIQLMQISKSISDNPETLIERIAKLYNEWIKFNETCKTKL